MLHFIQKETEEETNRKKEGGNKNVSVSHLVSSCETN